MTRDEFKQNLEKHGFHIAGAQYVIALALLHVAEAISELAQTITKKSFYG